MVKAPFATLTEKGLNGAFLLEYTSQNPSWLTMLAREVSSNQRIERYAGMGTQPLVERWAGEQHYGTMAETSLIVENHKYSGGVIIPGDEWRDDKVGQQRQRVRDLASEMRDKQSSIILDLITDNTLLGYDGQPLFSATHQAIPGDDTGNQSNLTDGSGSGVTADGWRTKIWQGITDTLLLLDDRGRKINRNMRRFVLIYHPEHMAAVEAALGDPTNSNGGTNTLNRQSKFAIEPYPEPLLPASNFAFLFALDRPSALPVIMQNKRGPVQHVIGEGSEWMKEHDSAKFGTNWEGGVAPWAWTSARRIQVV